MSGNIIIAHIEKYECWRVLPILKIFDVGNCSNADKEINIKKGISFKTKPRIKKKPYSSGIIKKFGGLSKPVSQGEKNLSNNPLGEKRKIKPIAIVICGRAIKGEMKIFI